MERDIYVTVTPIDSETPSDCGLVPSPYCTITSCAPPVCHVILFFVTYILSGEVHVIIGLAIDSIIYVIAVVHE